ncbi:MAG: VanZ family protein, partial [Flavobacteriales bacterium]
KVIHFLMFSLLSLSFSRSLAYYSIKNFNQTKSLICLISYALLMEILQDKMTTYRGFEWGDLMADFFGIIAGSWSAQRSILPFLFQHKIWKSA